VAATQAENVRVTFVRMVVTIRVMSLVVTNAGQDKKDITCGAYLPVVIGLSLITALAWDMSGRLQPYAIAGLFLITVTFEI
jgi:hypothetical protein